MAQFNNNAITEVGKLLLADVQTSGGVFDPTRIVLGSGYMPSSKTAGTMTDVVSPVISLDINKREKTPDGKAVLGSYYVNKDISEAFYWRELALYARVRYEKNGIITYSDEVLYSYGNAGATADYMPAYSTTTAVEKQIDLVTWIGNETEIYLTIEGGVYVTTKVVEQKITEVENNIYDNITYMTGHINHDLIAIGERLDVLERRVDEHDLEIAALKANDVFIHARLNEVASQTSAIWEASFSEVTENPAIVDFNTLTGFTLTGGVWNAPLRRLEV